MKRDTIFVSYSRSCASDIACRDELVRHLEIVLGFGSELRVFADPRIEIGEEWERRIHKELDRALVVVMLVSSDFLDSKFVRSVEIPRTALAARRGELTPACLYVRPSAVKHFSLPVVDPEDGNFQARLIEYQGINDPKRPAMSLDDVEREELLVQAAEEIAKLARERVDTARRAEEARRREAEAAQLGEPRQSEAASHPQDEPKSRQAARGTEATLVGPIALGLAAAAAAFYLAVWAAGGMGRSRASGGGSHLTAEQIRVVLDVPLAKDGRAHTKDLSLDLTGRVLADGAGQKVEGLELVSDKRSTPIKVGVEQDGTFGLKFAPARDALETVGFRVVGLGEVGGGLEVVQDTKRPTLSWLSTPGGGLPMTDAAIAVRVEARDSHLASVHVNSEAMTKVSGDLFEVEGVELVEGENTIRVEALDHAGNSAELVEIVVRDTTRPSFKEANSGVPDEASVGDELDLVFEFDEPCKHVSFDGVELKTDGALATGTVTVPDGSGVWRPELVVSDLAGNTRREALTIKRAMRPLSPGGWRVLDATPVDGWAKRVEDPTTGVVFVLIPAGKFTMGSPESEEGRNDREGPQHEVTIASPFYLAETEVTVAQWARVMGEQEGASSEPALPVVDVSWDDAVKFCEKAGYRLPSEAEWEYACRAGTTTPFSFDGGEEGLLKHGWFFRNSGHAELPAGTDWNFGKVTGEWGCSVQTVRQKVPNAWGLYDMHGNVFEWCQDTWRNNYKGAPRDGSAWGEDGSGYRVYRGGSFDVTARVARSAYRVYWHPSIRFGLLGFRPAKGTTD
ncbi:MAG: SUMF1/EgtB/PvdO family nonheme iron enzyme [Planctomycetota bacterium]